MVRKLPFKELMLAGWLLTGALLYASLRVEDGRVANILSDAFGTALGLVLLYSLGVGIAWWKRVI